MLKYISYYYTFYDSFAPKDASNLQKFGQVSVKHLLALVTSPFLLFKTVDKHKGKIIMVSGLREFVF